MGRTRPFTVAVIFSALHYLGLLTTLTAVGLLFEDRSQILVNLILSGLVFSLLMWVIALLKRRVAHCPLCKGTPLINSGALPHSRALRIGPFNHGVTATFSIIATQRFCCMYCGSDFDLLKTPSSSAS